MILEHIKLNPLPLDIPVRKIQGEPIASHKSTGCHTVLLHKFHCFLRYIVYFRCCFICLFNCAFLHCLYPFQLCHCWYAHSHCDWKIWTPPHTAIATSFPNFWNKNLAHLPVTPSTTIWMVPEYLVIELWRTTVFYQWSVSSCYWVKPTLRNNYRYFHILLREVLARLAQPWALDPNV